MKEFIKTLLTKYPNGFEVEITSEGKTTKEVKAGQDLINYVTSKARTVADAEALFGEVAKVEKPKKDEAKPKEEKEKK